jgi:hypothetical protein
VGLRIGLDVVRREKISAPAENLTAVVHPAAIHLTDSAVCAPLCNSTISIAETEGQEKTEELISTYIYQIH